MSNIMANDNSKILLEKELCPNLAVKFSYEYEKDNNIHNWQLLLQNNENNKEMILDHFSYKESDLPLSSTPDVWQETIYQLFSCLDAIIVSDDEILVFYDMFGEVHFTNYKIDAENRIVNKHLYPIKKYNLSFLLGYKSGYGKMLRNGNEIHAYYSVAAPPRENLICLSLENKNIKQIDFDENINTIEEKDLSILNLISQENRIKISQHLSKVLHEPIYIYGEIEDVNASQENGRGFVYYFSKQNKELSIFRLNLLKHEWIIGNYTEVDIN